MDANNVNGFAFEDAVRKVLEETRFLGARDAAADDGDRGGIETNFKFQMGGYVADPGFASRNGEYIAEGLVLDVYTL